MPPSLHPYSTNIKTFECMPKMDEFERVRVKVRGWLTSNSYAIRDLSENGNAWTMVGGNDDAYGVAISMKRGSPDLVSFGTTLMLRDYESDLGAMNGTNRKRLLYDVRIHLSGFPNIGFEVPDSFEFVNVASGVFVPELTKSLFWETMLKVDVALKSAIWMIDRELLGPKESGGK